MHAWIGVGCTLVFGALPMDAWAGSCNSAATTVNSGETFSQCELSGNESVSVVSGGAIRHGPAIDTNSATGSIANAGSIDGQSGIGIQVRNTSSLSLINNSGQINGAVGVHIDSGSTVTQLTNSASGTIQGSSFAIRNEGTLSNFSNSGVLDGKVELGGATLILSGPTARVTGDISGNGGSVVQVINGAFSSEANATMGDLRTANSGVLSLGSGHSWTSQTATIGVTGTAALTLAGGGLTVNGGTLQVGQGAGVGSLNIGAASGAGAGTAGTLNATTVALGNATSKVVFNHTDPGLAFGAAISGTGTVRVEAGTTLLTGTNTYSGGTTISGGTLQIGNGGASGSIVGNVANSSAFIFNRSGSLTYASVVSGTGSLGKTGSGTVILTGTNTYTGGTTISSGTLQIGSGATTGSIAGNVSNSGTLAFNRSNALTYAGIISGTGALTKAGAGALTLNGASTYSGTTTVSAGSIVAGGANVLSANSAYSFSGGTLNLANFAQSIGSLAGTSNVTLGSAALTAGGNNGSTTYNGIIGGTGSLIKTGSGTMTLSGANTYSGGTTVNGGTLQIGSGGTTGSIVGNVSNNGTLAFNRSNALIYIGIISGTGALTKAGAGALTLSGASTYSGATTVTAGSIVAGGANVLSANSAYTFSGGTLTLSNFAQTLGSLAGTSNVTLGSAALTAGGDNSSTTYSGVIAGTGSLIKAGSGTMTLTGTSTYTGGTTINSGILQIGSGGAGGSIVGNISNSSALVFNRSGSLTYASVVSGSGSLEKSGTGTVILTGANTYTGGTTINAGFLQIGNNTATGDIAGDVINNGTLAFSRSNAQTYAGVISGTGGLSKASAGALTLSGANTYAGTTSITAGSVVAGATNTFSSNSAHTLSTGTTINLADFSQTIGSLAGAGNVTLGSAMLTAGGNNSSTTYSAIISGTGALTKTGSGTMILTGANTYAGGTTVSGGTLQIGSGGTAGSIVGNVVNDGTLAFNRSNALTYAGLVSGVGSFSKAGAGVLTLTGDHTYTGGTTITAGTLQVGNAGTTGSIVGNVANSGTLTFSRSNALAYAGVISGTGNFSKAGGGTLTLSGASTYSGTSTITAGAIAAAAANVLSSLSAYTFSGGTLNLGGFAQTIASLAGTSNVALGSAALTAGGNNSNTTYSGIISGAGSLTKTGSGTMTLSGANTYTGGTTINAGTLQVGAGGGTGSIAGNVSNNSALIFNRTGSLTYAGVVSGAGLLSKAGSGTVILTGANTYTGGTTISSGILQIGSGATTGSISGNVNNNGTLAFNRSNALSYAGLISGTGALTKTGAGALTLTGASTYSGATTITTGSIVAGAANVLSANSAFTLGGGTLNLANFSQSIGSLAGSSNVTLGSATLTAGSNNSNTLYSGVISGTGALSKTGSGTMILSGANTYTGGTSINGGTLQIGNGSTTGSIAGNVANNGTLTFNRSDNLSFNGAVGGSGNLIKQGAGILTLNGLISYTGTTTISAGTLRAGSNNFLDSSSLVNIAAGAILDFNGFSGTLSNIQGDGSISNSGATSNLTLEGGSLNGAISGNFALVKNSSDTLILSGVNTYTGGTTINGGTLQVGNGGTSGSITSNVVNNANLAFNRSDDSSFNGNISGNGSLSKQGAGTLILTGNASHSGGTTISAGTLQVGNGGTSGSISGNVVNNANIAFNRSDDITYAGDISGTGALLKQGAGALTLSGASTYSGATTVSAGALVAGATNVFSASSAYTLSGGNLDLNNFSQILGSLAGPGNVALGSATLTTGGDDSSTIYSGVISGSGSLVKMGSGTMTLTGINTYTGGTTISGGTLRAGSNNFLTGSSPVIIAAGATLDLNGYTGILNNLQGDGAIGNSGSQVDLSVQDGNFNGGISGNFALVKDTAGTLILTGNANHSGGTTINAGTLQVGNGGTQGSISGDIANNSTIAFTRSDDISFSGVVSGMGALVKQGAGTLTLTGANAYDGGTTISTGTLQIGNSGTTGSINGDIINNANLAFNRSDDISFSGVVSGTGSLVKHGAGTLTLTGTNTYTGNTTVSTGTLQVGNGGTSGSIDGNINNNSALIFNRSDDLGFAGSISGSGALTKLGVGVLTLTNNASHSGGTTISAGTLQVGNGGTSGSIAGNIDNNANLAFNRSNNLAYAGDISGSGMLTKDGSGTLTLTGANTHSGGTTLNAGTLQVGNGGTSGSINGNINNNSALVFNRSNGLAYAGDISGSGSVAKNGAGTLTLTGANTHSGGTTVNAGTLQIGNGGTSGSITGNISNNGALAFNRSDSFSHNGEISGSGSVTKLGSGTLALTGSNTYTGGTIINAGVLQVGGGGTTGGISGNVTNNATLAFNRSDDFAYAGEIGGSGTLVKDGAGTFTLSGANSYSGTTTIAAGRLNIGNGGTSGVLGSGAVINNGVLAFNRSDAYTAANTISGTGSVEKAGAGNLILSGVNTYTGGTAVNGGTLSVNGSLVGQTTVNSGGALGGIGNTGAVMLASGGALAPGNSIGRLTINGDLVLGSGAVYRVEVNAAGASDRTVVNGNVTLAGNVDVRAENGSYASNTRYTILTHTGTRTGTFDSVSSNLAFLTPTLDYAANAVELAMARNDASFASVAETRNQRAVANNIEAQGSGSIYDDVSGLSATQARAAYDTLSGTQHAAASQVAMNLGRSFSGALMNRAAVAGSRFGGASSLRYASLDLSGVSSWQGLFASPHQLGRTLAQSAPTASGTHLNAAGASAPVTTGTWVQVLGGTGEVKSNGNGTGSDYSSSAFIAGYDTMLNTDWLMGVAVGYGKTQWDADMPATGNIDTPYAALYGRYSAGPWQIRLNGGYADNRFSTTRTVIMGGTSSNVSSKHNGQEWSMAAEAEYTAGDYAGWSMRPLAAIRYAYMAEEGFTESGSPEALKIKHRSTQQANLGVGSRFMRTFDGNNGALEFRAMVTHLAGDNDAPVTASFIGQTSTFNVDGTPLRRTALVLGFGLSHQIANRLSAFIDVGYETRGSGQFNAGAGVGLQYRW